MSDDFTNILSQISEGSTNKQIQELGMILTRTLEIVINAVDMLESNLNSINASLSARIDALEKKIQELVSAGGSLSTTPQAIDTGVSPSKQIPETTPQQEATTAVQSTENSSDTPMTTTPSQPAIPQAPPAAPATMQTSQVEAPKPISPINIRKALNTELKQLFSKMRA
ncbi:MAG: hypothetical protein ACTSYR_01065, partial [Candidatus Odinarchaeia archaeon]